MKQLLLAMLLCLASQAAHANTQVALEDNAPCVADTSGSDQRIGVIYGLNIPTTSAAICNSSAFTVQLSDLGSGGMSGAGSFFANLSFSGSGSITNYRPFFSSLGPIGPNVVFTTRFSDFSATGSSTVLCTPLATCFPEHVAFFVDTFFGGAAANYSMKSLATGAVMAHSGPARFGATGDPLTGFEMDVQGDAIVTQFLRVGGTPTATPTATATGATPTATGVTPTPTVTNTPGPGDVLIQDQLFVGGTSSFTGAMTGAAGLTLSGGSLTVSSGNISMTLFGAQTITKALGNLTVGTTSNNALFFLQNNVNVAKFAAGGHLTSLQATAPTLSSCGTSPSTVTGTDQNGTFTVGTIATACTLTFTTAWVNTPMCFANDRTSVLAVRVTPTTTTAVFDTATAASISSQVIDYWCIGRE